MFFALHFMLGRPISQLIHLIWEGLLYLPPVFDYFPSEYALLLIRYDSHQALTLLFFPHCHSLLILILLFLLSQSLSRLLFNFFLLFGLFVGVVDGFGNLTHPSWISDNLRSFFPGLWEC